MDKHKRIVEDFYEFDEEEEFDDRVEGPYRFEKYVY
jgi:hypothetical protein